MQFCGINDFWCKPVVSFCLLPTHTTEIIPRSWLQISLALLAFTYPECCSSLALKCFPHQLLSDGSLKNEESSCLGFWRIFHCASTEIAAVRLFDLKAVKPLNNPHDYAVSCCNGCCKKKNNKKTSFALISLAQPCAWGWNDCFRHFILRIAPVTLQRHTALEDFHLHYNEKVNDDASCFSCAKSQVQGWAVIFVIMKPQMK